MPGLRSHAREGAVSTTCVVISLCVAFACGAVVGVGGFVVLAALSADDPPDFGLK